DNQARNNPPDIGADEFTTPADDAHLLNTLLTFPICPGNNAVTARFRNVGTATLTSLMFGWEVNNVLQTPFAFNGSINSGDSSSFITIGNYNFLPDHVFNLKIWCYLPNGNTDPSPQYDTITITGGQTKMTGTYAIGGLSQNYSSFSDAVAALNTRGVCSPVTFNVWDGYYVEKVYLTHIAGSSPVNRITFQSANQDSSLVHLQIAASTSGYQNYVIQFDGADYITFRKISIHRIDYPLSDYGLVVSMINSAVGNILENNRIEGETYASPSYPNAGEAIISSGNLVSLRNDSNIIQNNLIVNGTSGLIIGRATSSTIPPETGWIVRNNQFVGQSESAIQAVNQNNILIQDNTINTIRDTVSSSTFFGIYLYECYNHVNVSYNRINHKTGLGIAVINCHDTIINPALVSNNMISNKQTGLFVSGSTNYRFVHNNLNMYGPVATSDDFYQVSSSGITLWNNILQQSNGGKIFFITPSTSLMSNHNDFYTTGAFSNSYPSLNQWQATMHDTNSVFIQPGFISTTDLHIPFNDSLNNLGDSIGIADDFDHVHRYQAHPDMGADEFDSAGVYDIGVAHFINPDGVNCHGMPRVLVSVKNYDPVLTDTVKTFTVYLKINSSMVDTVSWNGILIPGDSVQVVATPFFLFQYAQNYTLSAWTSLPNNSLDSHPQ
ncbi:MAG TPA: right-handed parallel beta-helix repeat-containing protein, partial [Bacteroidia bacterium]|nr:right-handed parallel beta-helix repeat-containing protein [Bacteroidia bacterium]